jgi:hypothetical protein
MTSIGRRFPPPETTSSTEVTMNAKKSGFASEKDGMAEGWVVGFCIARAIAAVALVGVIVACAPAEATRSADSAVQQTGQAFEYFPAQYTNQAKHVEEHIQAF